MKKIIVSAFATCLINSHLPAQDSTLRKISNSAFTTNEVLEYRVHYGFIDAGEARLEISPDIKTFANRSIYHVIGTGKTKGAFDWFFKFVTVMKVMWTVLQLYPWYFIRRVDEGATRSARTLPLIIIKNIAISEKKTITVPRGTQDIVSAYYYARTLNFDTAKVNDVYSFNAYLDDEVIPMSIKFLGREKVKTSLGTFNCIKFRPVLLVGRVFKEEEDMTIWVTDDKNKSCRQGAGRNSGGLYKNGFERIIRD
jgi:hypothetical protein